MLRVRPASISGIRASTPSIFCMLRRTMTWGRPVVAETWRT